MDLLQAFDRWRAVFTVSPGTVEDYRYSLLRLARAGIAKLEQATAPAVSGFVADRVMAAQADGRDGREAARKDVAALCAVVRYLVSCGIAHELHLRALRATRPRVRRPRPFHAPYLTPPRYEELRAGARARDEVSRRNCPERDADFLVQVGCLSGLRAGEMSRLPWARVDRQRRVVEVRLAPELGALGRIKTMQERDVPICDELLELFERRAASHGSEGYVFRHGMRASVNAHATVKTLRRELTFARQNAGMPDVTFHLLRHTRASWWLQGNGTQRASLEEVSLWLGDDPDTVARNYAGLLQGYHPNCEARPAA